MENGNGVAKRIPIGFRFRPTDGELVIHYLRRKVFALPLPPLNPIPELDVFNVNPWDLPGEGILFQQTCEGWCVNKCGEKLITGCGYWKATGKHKPVVAPGTNIVIAIKKSFVFHTGKSTKTQWIMRQFRLVGAIRTPNNLTQKSIMQVGDWVVCGIYQSNKKPKEGVQPANFKKSVANVENYMGLPSAQDSPSSPCLSGITDAISYSDMGKEEANSHNA